MSTAIGPVVASAGLPGGVSAVLNITAALVVKSSPGVLFRIVVSTAGSGSSLTLNDCATVGAAAASNQIGTWSSLTVGQILEFDWPCGTGIVISSVVTSSVIAVSFS